MRKGESEVMDDDLRKVLADVIDLLEDLCVDCPDCGSDFENMASEYRGDDDGGCYEGNCPHYWQCERDHRRHLKVIALQEKMKSMN